MLRDTFLNMHSRPKAFVRNLQTRSVYNLEVPESEEPEDEDGRAESDVTGDEERTLWTVSQNRTTETMTLRTFMGRSVQDGVRSKELHSSGKARGHHEPCMSPNVNPSTIGRARTPNREEYTTVSTPQNATAGVLHAEGWEDTGGEETK